MLPRVAMLSMWRNDQDRSLLLRVKHLTGKTYPNLRWVWVVGDSDDSTEDQLRQAAILERNHHGRSIEVMRFDSGIAATDSQTRMQRCNAAFNAALDHVYGVDNVIWHESDLVSPPDLVERMLSREVDVLGGWPTLILPSGLTVFYDTWGYRADGTKFTNEPPYHAVYRPDDIFEVETVGSVLMCPAAPIIDGLRSPELGVVDLCLGLRANGYRVWVDPTLEIMQPTGLWEPKVGWK